jgi:hypothetical protein
MELGIGKVCAEGESHLGDSERCGVTIQFKDLDRSAFTQGWVGSQFSKYFWRPRLKF